VKALGKGLSHPLDAFDVSAGAHARFAAFRDGYAPADWSLVDLELGAGRVPGPWPWSSPRLASGWRPRSARPSVLESEALRHLPPSFNVWRRCSSSA
jgi:hypothetical protein